MLETNTEPNQPDLNKNKLKGLPDRVQPKRLGEKSVFDRDSGLC